MNKDTVVQDKIHPRYPLIIMRTYTYHNGNKSRTVLRNTKYDNRWYGYKLSLLYARQVAKLGNYLWVHRGKFIMEIPFLIQDLYGDDAIEEEYEKNAISINTPEGYAMKKGYKKLEKEVDSIEILNEELENE